MGKEERGCLESHLVLKQSFKCLCDESRIQRSRPDRAQAFVNT